MVGGLRGASEVCEGTAWTDGVEGIVSGSGCGVVSNKRTDEQ